MKVNEMSHRIAPTRTVLDRGQILIEEKAREEAREVVEKAHDRRITGVTLNLEDGAEIALPRELAQVIDSVINGLTQGGLAVRSTPDVLTTTTAASILGVSRPTVVKMAKDGVIPSWKVGAHRRFNLSDVLRLQEERRARQLKAFEELRALDEELGIEE